MDKHMDGGTLSTVFHKHNFQLLFDYPILENTRGVSFDIMFTRQGFENAC